MGNNMQIQYYNFCCGIVATKVSLENVDELLLMAYVIYLKDSPALS
jgi:hypothetical protein